MVDRAGSAANNCTVFARLRARASTDAHSVSDVELSPVFSGRCDSRDCAELTASRAGRPAADHAYGAAFTTVDDCTTATTHGCTANPDRESDSGCTCEEEYRLGC